MFELDIVHVYTNATVYDCNICIRCAHESQTAGTRNEIKLRALPAPCCSMEASDILL